MAAEAIYVRIVIRAPIERVWELTQSPELHSRWDLRFSSIRPTGELASGGYRFAYERRMPLHTIRGTGTSLGERQRPDGTRTSALRFDTGDRLSPLGAGRGYWRYEPQSDGSTVFITGYDYVPNWGILDRLGVRRLVGWMTAWSFDRLRIWAETGVEPDRWSPLSVLAVWDRGRPRAVRCSRHAPGRDAMAAAPATLSTLEAP
jgi:hypothetical protein